MLHSDKSIPIQLDRSVHHEFKLFVRGVKLLLGLLLRGVQNRVVANTQDLHVRLAPFFIAEIRSFVHHDLLHLNHDG